MTAPSKDLRDMELHEVCTMAAWDVAQALLGGRETLHSAVTSAMLLALRWKAEKAGVK